MRKSLKMLVGGMLAATMLLSGCENSAPSNSQGDTGNAPAQSSNAEREQSMKIAVIRNMTSSDHTSQFFKGATEEGQALGYTVDTFMSDGDDVKMQNLMEQAMNQDYDIWIVSHANEGYQYDILSKAVDKGIKVVGFDCGGEHVPGVTYTSQSDGDLTKISLDALIEKAEEEGKTQPIQILEVNTLGAIVPFDTRHGVVEEYEAAGKIKVTQMISPNLAGDFYSEINTAITAAVNNGVEFDGVWTASTSFLDAIMDALHAANKEVIVTGIDISDTEVERLTREPSYYCCAAVDPYVIGMVDVRIGVLKALGVDTPEEVQFPAVGVFNTDVKEGDSMATLAGTMEGFGESDLYDTEELQAMRK